MPSDPRLLVPATHALLDGWCGPVVVDGHEEVWTRGRLLVVDEDDEAMWWGEDVDHGDLRLDLSRAEVRDRVARCLAATMTGGPVGDEPPIFYFQWHQPRYTRSNARRQRMATIGRLVCWVDRDDPAEPRLGPKYGGVLPSLADLDPGYPGERLPDGSRWVDAAALAAVARHVLGVA
jgi:hypothetical protein